MTDENEYLKPEQIKPFLLHEDTIVRSCVATYFRESQSRDPDLAALVFEACNRYGVAKNTVGVDACRTFSLTRESAARLPELLAESDNPFVVDTLNEIIASVNLTLVILCREQLQKAPRVSPDTWEILRHRMELECDPPLHLWAALEQFSTRVRGTHCPDCLDQTYPRSLVAALAEHDQPADGELVEKLAQCSGKGDWGDLFLIDLIGKRQVKQAMRLLIDCYGFRSDHFAERATEAVVRIDAPGTIRELCARIGNEDIDFRTRAPEALAGIKQPEAERALRRLLDKESDPRLTSRLGYAWCSHFPAGDQDLMRRVIETASSIEAPILKSWFFTNAIIRGLELPEAETWREEILNAEWDSRDYMEPILDCEDLQTSPAPFRRSRPRVGRNEPCICGSGTKYKRCCGRNEGPPRFDA